MFNQGLPVPMISQENLEDDEFPRIASNPQPNVRVLVGCGLSIMSTSRKPHTSVSGFVVLPIPLMGSKLSELCHHATKLQLLRVWHTAVKLNGPLVTKSSAVKLQIIACRPSSEK